MSRVLIVTGMHRSGTSLVASHLARSGLDLGRELLAPDVGNPRGYFEDVLIHDFHRRALQRHGIKDGFTVTPAEVPIVATEADEADAQRIVCRFGDRDQYGWKEPRTALFLRLWAKLLPDATFLLVFRRPDVVLDSLMRRASNASVVERPATALEMWRAHNSEMLSFWQEHPDRCIWAGVDAYVADPGAFIERVRARDFELTNAPIGDVLVEDDLHRDVRLRARLVCMKNRTEWQRCMRLYGKIRDIH